ncbi:MAG TPA: CpaF family protein [Chloroflexi bacterium]|nr:CpaF family protein [Chloroflexota bacterium]
MSILSKTASGSTSSPQGSSTEKLRSYLTNLISRELAAHPVPQERRPEAVRKLLEQAYAHAKVNLPSTLKAQLFKDVEDELLGYGPIQPFLEDPDVSEVMVNGPENIFIEKDGRLVKTNARFRDDAHVIRIIERIVLPLGRRVDADNPMVDARLPDGSRVNAVIPPIAIDGPSITIRKFRRDKLSVEQLIEYGSLTESMAEFLRACVVSRLNIVISGGTGSGKTTLLNVLSGFIPEDERIVTIEDAAELQLRQEHVVRLETRTHSADNKRAITVRDLVRNALRMRPDRIVVGECRGGETLDMLQAMNTGHDGSLTTLHANTPRDALSRMETMALMAGLEMPLKVIREQIASAVDLIVQQSRLRDGSRKVTSITEVVGMEGDTVVMTEVFRFTQTGMTTDGKILGELKPTGIRPLFMPRLEAAGFKLGPQVFGVNVGEMLSDRRRRRR